MADAVEASSRSLEKFNSQTVNELVERIFTMQEKDDQFAEAPLTRKDVAEIKEIFRKRLLNIHHSRMACADREV